MERDDLHKLLDNLLNKYLGNEYILGRLETYITPITAIGIRVCKSES